MKRIFVEAGKEWCELKRDRLSIALAVILPLLTLLLFGYGVRLQIKNIPIVVQDFDNSQDSRSFVARLYATDALVPGSWVGRKSPAGALDAGGAKVAIVIPSDFSRDLATRRTGSVQALIDGSDVVSAHVIRGIMQGISIYFSSLVAPVDPRALHVIPQTRVWFNPGGKESLFIVPGVYGIILFMYPALLAAIAASREVEQKTIVQVFSSRMNAVELLLGKGLICFAVGMVEALIIMSVGWLLFDVHLVVDPTPLMVATPIYVCTAVLFGLLVGTYANSQTVAVQATSTGGFFPTLLLSGFVYPLSNVPFPLSLFADIVPARYYIEVARDAFVRGTGWSCTWYQPLILLLFAMTYFVFSWTRLRSMQLRD